MAGKCPPELVAQFVEEAKTKTTKELARAYGRAQSTIRDWKQDLDIKPLELSFPPPGGQIYEIEDVYTTGMVVTSDYQFPFYSPASCWRVTRAAEKYDCPDLAIVGDLFDADHFTNLDKVPRGSSFGQDLDDVDKLFDEFLRVFENIYVMPGNHDWRIMRTLGFQVTFPEVARMLRNSKAVKFFSLPQLCVNDRYLLVHPNSYSRKATMVAVDLCVKYRMTVLSAHGHQAGFRYDPSGEDIGMDLGGMFDESRIEYRHAKPTTHGAWNPAFAIIKEKGILPFSPGLLTWEEL